MNGSYLAFALGSNTFFSSRVFFPAFMVALALRFPDLFGMESVPLGEQWIADNGILVALGFLSILESWANRNPEFYEFWERIDKFVKLGAAVAINIAILDPQITEALFDAKHPIGDFDPTVVGAAVSTPVFFLAMFRRKILDYLRNLDEDNDIGLITLAQWLEDGWIFFGVLFLVVLPVATFIIILFVLAGLLVLRKTLDLKEDQSRMHCESCRELVYRSALTCPHCKAPVKETRDVSLLGQTLSEPIDSPEVHRLKLLSVKRCPTCANRLQEKLMNQICPACGNYTLTDNSEIQYYGKTIDERLKQTLIVSFIVGFIPVVGSIATIIYTKLHLVKPYSQYISYGKGFIIRFMTKIGIIIMFIMQPIPVIGYIACPAISLIYYYSWRSGFNKQYQFA